MTIALGLTAKLEDWFVGVLTALEYEGELVFRTVAAVIPETGLAADNFTKYQPFAFVSYWPADAAREGDHDLRQVLRFAILIGAEAREAGLARRGSTAHVGVSLMRDLVIAALDGVDPGLETDTCYYLGETEMLDKGKQYATELHFKCNYTTNS